MIEVKEYGLHRSGTNFLRVLLQENYEVRVLTNIGGWKHGPFELPEQLGREVDCLISIKNPYAWLLSYYNYLHPQKDVAFDEFVRGAITIRNPLQPEKPMPRANPVEHWVKMNEHWLGFELKGKRKFIYRYEDVLADPYESIQGLVRTLGLQRRKRWWHKFVQVFRHRAKDPPFFIPSIRLGAVPQRYKNKHIKRGERFDPQHYKKQHYLEAFTADLLDFVNGQLKPELLGTLGYSYVSSDALTEIAGA